MKKEKKNSENEHKDKELSKKQKIIKWVAISLHIINGIIVVGFLVYLYFLLSGLK